MKEFCDKSKSNRVVIDMVCPTRETRRIINPDIVIWMDTIKKGRFEDTNMMFEPVERYDYKISTFNAEYWSTVIASRIINH